MSRTGDPAVALTVTWEVVLSGTASAADFAGPLTGTINSWADALPRTITVDVAADTIAELGEDFTVELVGAPGAVIAQPSAGGTITDDDTAILSIDDVTLSEGDAGFSGATGGARNSHDILEWEMTTSASSPSDLLTLSIAADSISEEAGAAATTATVTRGPGNDTANISHTSAGPAITLAEAGGTGTVDFGVGQLEALIDIENVIGSLGDDEITGNSQANGSALKNG